MWLSSSFCERLGESGISGRLLLTCRVNGLTVPSPFSGVLVTGMISSCDRDVCVDGESVGISAGNSVGVEENGVGVHAANTKMQSNIIKWVFILPFSFEQTG